MQIVFSLIYVVIGVACGAGLWKMFQKMGRPGWEGLVPFYNVMILTKVVDQPPTSLIIAIIPYLNFPFYKAVAAKFGQTAGFGVAMGIFFPFAAVVLGFGPAQFQGATNTVGTEAAPVK